ncbi:MAG: hypothetical protein DIU62_004960 [Pseudomonadota bacterium]
MTAITIGLWIIAIVLLLVRAEKVLRAAEQRDWRKMLVHATALTLDVLLSTLVTLALSAIVPPSIGAAPSALAGIYISSRIVRIVRRTTRPTAQ